MKMIDDLLAWLNQFFHTLPPKVPDPIVVPPPPPPPPPPPKISKGIDDFDIEGHKDNFGTFYYLDNVLDCLDNYMTALHRLKKSDREAYLEYRKVGGRIIGRRALFQPFNLEPVWKHVDARPAFGMVHFHWELSAKLEKQECELRLLFFRKLKCPPRIQHFTKASPYEVAAHTAGPETHEADAPRSR